jgi:hypothetical protein
VTFRKPAGPAGSGTGLPVQWESVEPGDGFTVLLDGDITLAPAAGQAQSTLTLAGSAACPTAPRDGVHGAAGFVERVVERTAWKTPGFECSGSTLLWHWCR